MTGVMALTAYLGQQTTGQISIPAQKRFVETELMRTVTGLTPTVNVRQPAAYQ
jgi:hypothetical protein